MNNIAVLVLALLYFSTGIVYAIREINYIRKQRMVNFLSINRIMFCFVYGFLPAVVFYRVYHGVSNITLNFSSSKEITEWYIVFILSVMAYCFFCIGYSTKHIRVKIKGFSWRKKVKKSKNITSFYERESVILLTIIALIVIGWVSVVLWTKAYGSIYNFIQNANMIRSGRTSVKNSLAFFKEFVKVFPMAFYGCLFLFLQERKMRKKLIWLLLGITSLLGCIVYMLASDSRTSIGLVVVGAMLVLLHYNIKVQKKSIKNQLLLMAVLLIGGYFCVIMSEYWMRGFRQRSSMEYVAFDIFSSIEKEFRYIFISQDKAFDLWLDGEIPYKLFDDIVDAIFSWIPSRFHPSNMPESMWAYNTRIVGYSATAPTDILTCSLYHIGIWGIVVIPFIYAKFVRWIDDFGQGMADNMFLYSFYLGTVASQLTNISHFEFSSIVLKMFPSVLSICIYCFMVILTNRFYRRINAV